MASAYSPSAKCPHALQKPCTATDHHKNQLWPSPLTPSHTRRAAGKSDQLVIMAVVTQTDGRPAEYRWVEHWPRSSGGGWVLLGTCVLVLAAVPGPPLFLHVAVGINGLMFLACSRTPRRPAVRIVDGVAVLGLRPYSHAPTLLFLVVSLYGAVQ